MTVIDERNFDLNTALEDAELNYAAANPKSSAAYEDALNSLPGGNTRSVLYYPPFPLSLSGGAGCHVTDIDGHTYVDFQVEQTAGLYGHSENIILNAIYATLAEGITLGGPTWREAALADLFVKRFPAVEKVRFTNSGTEANLLALSTARAVTGRSKIMAFRGSYHGSVLSFGTYGQGLNIPFDWVMGRFNDVEGTRAEIREQGDDLAAIIIEPMTGSGGCIPATDEFVTMLRMESERIGALLVFDEVMTSRLSPGGLHGLWKITPDLVTFGKFLGGGLSFGAFGGADRIMNAFDPRRPDALTHAGTFNNNVLTMSAAIAGLKNVYTPEAAQALNADGDRLRERLNAAIADQGIAGQVTGLGSMMMVHLTSEKLTSPEDTRKIDTKIRDLLHLALIDRGYYIARRNMIVLSLPMKAPEFNGLVDAFSDALACYRGFLPQI